MHAPGLGIDTLLAPIRPRTADTVGPDFYRTIIRSLQRMYDVVVMDTGVQYLDPLIAQVALPEAEEIIFVTTLASTAVQGMARALREITAPVERPGWASTREDRHPREPVGGERRHGARPGARGGLGVPVVGVIPLATKDVLTATNLNRMHSLPGPPAHRTGLQQAQRACPAGPSRRGARSTLPREQQPRRGSRVAGRQRHRRLGGDESGRRRGLFRR